ncbi:hypothetical protein [Breoghania sp.]|nr:hypothetical protein [Breoghania sp.]
MKALFKQHHHDLVAELRDAMQKIVLPHLDEIESTETILDEIYRYMAEAG